MISWFKKHFIPHEGNNHRPHFLHKKNICNILLIIICLEIFIFIIPTILKINRTGGLAAVLPAIMAELTNEERQNLNLNSLTTNPLLEKAAKLKAEDMAQKGYFAHTSPEGKSPWYWLEQAGYKYQYAGENLAVNFNDSKDVTKAWMDSPSHKSNILKDKYTEVGTGIATGIYQGKEAVFVVQVYANPLKESPIIVRQVDKEIINKNITTNKKPIDNIRITEKESSNILGAETNSTKVEIENTQSISKEDKINMWQKTFASPRSSMSRLLFVIFGVVIFALILYILIKTKNYHSDLITNALFVVVIIGAIFIINNIISQKDMHLTRSINYTNIIK